jgi:hypothetical protein
MIKISSDRPGRIKVAFPYKPEHVAKIKAVKAHRWHPEEKFWSLPYSKPVLEEILSSFAGEEFDIAALLQSLVSQILPHTCWKRTTTSGQSRNCWGIMMCQRQ